MSNVNMIAIAAAEARDSAKDAETLEERLRAAMRATVDHWMATDEADQMTAAISAALSLTTDPEEKERLESTIDVFKHLALAAGGASVNLIPLLDRAKEAGEPLPLRLFWDEAQAEVRAGRES